MIKPTSHLLSRLAIAALVSLAVLAGLLALRLFQGPLSLAVLTPFIESAMDDALGDYRAHIDDTVLRWSRDEGRVDLRFVGVTLRDKEQRAVLAIPEMEVGFSAKGLLRGLLAPAEVQLIGPSATIMRDPDGKLQLGFQAPGDAPADIKTDELVQKILDDLRTPQADSVFGYLERFYIRDAGLTLYDSITRSIWRAPNSLIALTRTAQALSLRLDAKVEAGEGSFGLSAEAKLAEGDNNIDANIHLNGLRLSRLAKGTNGLEPFAGVDVPVHGDANLSLALDGAIKQASFWLFANGGRVIVPGLPSVALDLRAAEAKGTFDAATDKIRLERLAYDAGSNRGFMVGDASLQRTPQGLISGLSFNLQADGIALDMPDLFSARGKIDHVTFRGALNLEINRLTIDEASLRMADTALVLAGSVDDRPEGVGVKIDGSIEHLAVTDFAKLWPIGPARGARDWITENIHTGEITRGALHVKAQPGQLAGAGLPDEVVDFAFEFAGLDVTYIRGLTPVTGAHGHARLTGNRFELALSEGKIGSLTASQGHFAVNDLEEHGAPGAIDVHLAGDAAQFLTVLDMQPLGYPSQFGIDPKTVGGALDGHLSVIVPMRRAVKFADIVLKVEARTKGLSLPPVYRDFEVSEGALDFAVTNDALEAKGSARLGGYASQIHWREAFANRDTGRPPTQLSIDVTLDEAGRTRAIGALDRYIEGQLPLRLGIEGAGQTVSRVTLEGDLTQAQTALPQFGWSKAAGAPSHLKFVLDLPDNGEHLFNDIVLEGPDLLVKGKAVLDENGKFRLAAFDPFKAGADTDAQLLAEQKRDKDGVTTLNVTVRGAAFAAGDLLKDYKDDLDRAHEAGPAAAAKTRESQVFSVDLKQLTLANGVRLSPFKGRYERRLGALRDLSVNGTIAPDAPLSMTLTPDDTGARALKIESADAGALLSGLDLTNNLGEGTMVLDVTLPPLDESGQAAPGHAVTGTVLIKDVRVVKAPILTNILSVGSFGGIRDMLNGEGLLFETIDLPFRVEGDMIAVGAGRAYGPSVGLTIEGRVPRGPGDYDMSGTLVPAYTLNTLLGYVPILGKLLTSREGEGVVGLTYEVHGPSSDPHVVVNPLSALTPGFLRRIFQFGNKSEDMKDSSSAPTSQ